MSNIYDLTGHKIKDTYGRLLQISSSSDSVVRNGLGEPNMNASFSGSVIAGILDIKNMQVTSSAAYGLVMDGTRVKSQILAIYNIDGGVPGSVYGGILTSIDGGSI